jgi:hypothetical protein
MAKMRSPQYPAIGLKEAIEKIAMVYERDYQNTVPRSVIAEHMGYSGLSGKSLSVLSAMGKFGLLEGRGDGNRASDLAVAIIAHPPGTPERTVAIKEASGKPELFAELDAKFNSGKASDQAIRSYLLTQKFIPSAADSAVRSYRETKQFVESESVGYNAPLSDEPEPQPMEVTSHAAARSATTLRTTLASEAEPFRLTFLGKAMEITGRIDTEQSADDLIRAITALKALVRPAVPANRPESAPDQKEEAAH